MIRRAHRFHGHASLTYLYAHGRSVRRGVLTLRYVPNARRESYRIAVVVSRKVSKSAVVRNRIRRRIYELVRILYTSPVVNDAAITVFDEKIATLSALDLEAEVTWLLQKAGMTARNAAEHAIVDTKE